MNLEDVHQRDGSSVVTQDHVLDLWITADRQVHWKDEDELEAAVEAQRFSTSEAERFRADAHEVEGLVRRWRSPFADRWNAWRPDPAWPIPGLPPEARWDFDADAPGR